MDLHSKYTFLPAQKATPFQVGKARWLYKSAQKCRFFSQKHFFMLFLERNREFCSCSRSEICKFQVQEDKADAHVDTFDEPPTAVPLGVFRQTAILVQQHEKNVSLRTPNRGEAISIQQCCRPFRGVGRLRLSLRGSLEPHLGKCNDLRLFLYLYKIWQESLLNKG